VAEDLFFSSRKDAEPQRNCGALGLTSEGLGALESASADIFFFFLRAKAPRPARRGGRKEI